MSKSFRQKFSLDHFKQCKKGKNVEVNYECSPYEQQREEVVSKIIDNQVNEQVEDQTGADVDTTGKFFIYLNKNVLN